MIDLYFSAHSLTFYPFAVVTFPRGMFLDVVGGVLGGGGVPLGGVARARLLVLRRLMRLIL